MKWFLVVALALPVLALGADVSPLPEMSFFSELLKLLGGWKGMEVKALVVALVQLAITFLRTPFGAVAGKWKLVLVLALSIVATVLGHLFSGMSLVQALLDGTVLAAVQVFANELVKHLTQKPVLHPVEAGRK